MTIMKYAALTLSALAAATLASGLAYLGVNQGATHTGAHQPVVVATLTPQQLAEQNEIRLALAALRSFAVQDEQADLDESDSSPSAQVGWSRWAASDFGSIFASSKPVKSNQGALPLTEQGSPADATLAVALPDVSLVLQSGGVYRAVVDGFLVRVGDTVSDGSVVRSIAMEAVTFSSRGQERVVPVPLERLRVLGAYPVALAKEKR